MNAEKSKVKRILEIAITTKSVRIALIVVAGITSQAIIFKAIEAEPFVLKERPESTQLLIDTFKEMLAKTTRQLTTCMTVVDACNETKETIDKQIKSIFELRKKDFCD